MCRHKRYYYESDNEKAFDYSAARRKNDRQTPICTSINVRLLFSRFRPIRNCVNGCYARTSCFRPVSIPERRSLRKEYE